MPNYYEILKIAPTATEAEIRQAYDDKNTYWRRLVNHHDPKRVDEANGELRQLEEIQTILLNPMLRKVYDTGLGVSGGLADPSAILQSQSFAPAPPVPAPPKSNAPEAQPAAANAASLWACNKCGTANPEHTKFCLKCANQLVRQCPACKNESSLVSTGICGVCGSNYDATLREQERKQALQDAYEQQRRELDPQVKKIDEELARIGSELARNTSLLHVTFLLIMVPSIAFFGLLLMMGFISELFSRRSSDLPLGMFLLVLCVFFLGVALLWRVFRQRQRRKTQIPTLTSRKQALQSERAMLLAEFEQARPKRTL